MNILDSDRNIVLIGMPGVGKSTVGVLLAKALSREFVDTDILIQAAEGRRLQDIIDRDGLAAFLAIEERHVRALNVRRHVIATGGSVVYSEAAMDHLAANGIALYLELPLPLLRDRVRNFDSRGVVMPRGQSLDALYDERAPLYRRHARAVVDCAGHNHEETVAAVIHALGPRQA